MHPERSHKGVPRIPVLADDARRIVFYQNNHLNDFCLFQDADGVWHAIGIMGTGSWDSEVSLFHSVSEDLTKVPFTNLAPILTDLPPNTDVLQKHSPFVVCQSAGADRVRYCMFYRRPMGTIIRVTTYNPFEWRDYGEIVFSSRDARDPCILSGEGRYLMYYCESVDLGGTITACILVRRSPDLESWSEPDVAFRGKQAKHSYLESPFVVRRPEGYYLFIRHRRSWTHDPISVVTFSPDPLSFGNEEEGWLATVSPAHAPEVVVHGNRWYLAQVSGPRSPSFDGLSGWITLTTLRWCMPDEAQVSDFQP